MDEAVYMFDRRCKVVLATQINDTLGQALEIEGLHVRFRVVKTLDKGPNTADIRIYNLSDATRAALPAKGARVELLAGYAGVDGKGTVSRVFIGDVRTIESKRDNADWITEIQAGEGESAWVGKRVLESYAAKTTALDVFKRVAAKLIPAGGLLTPEAEAVLATARDAGQSTALNAFKRAQKQAGYILSPEAENVLRAHTFEYGHVASGGAAEMLTQILEGLGLEWSIQDNRIRVLVAFQGRTTIAQRDYIPDKLESVVVVSPETGLLESPWYSTAELKGKKPPILKARSLLQPSVLPGGRVKLVSAKHDSLFRVLRVVHYGDTDGGHWFSELELEVTGTAQGTHA